VRDSPTAEQFGERLFGAVLGAPFTQAAYLGWYRALAADGPLTPAEPPAAPTPRSATPVSGASTRRCAACSPSW
jgi:hypothetical protein